MEDLGQIEHRPERWILLTSLQLGIPSKAETLTCNLLLCLTGQPPSLAQIFAEMP